MNPAARNEFPRPEERIIPDYRKKPAPLRRPLFGLRRLFSWRRVLGLLLLAILFPVLTGLVYRAEFIHPVSTKMAWRWLTGAPVERNWIEFEEIAPVMLHSVIMSEDGRFCSHRGVDWNELDSVIDDALEGERTRGASTIPMQTAKNLFLWSSRSYLRKALEIPLALYIEVIWPKRRILEIYLNIAEWDEGVFGVEAAAQHYFGRSAADLGRRQAALLTVTLPDPDGRNPARPSGTLNRLAGIIQSRAAKAGAYIGCLKEDTK